MLSTKYALPLLAFPHLLIPLHLPPLIPLHPAVLVICTHCSLEQALLFSVIYIILLCIVIVIYNLMRILRFFSCKIYLRCRIVLKSFVHLYYQHAALIILSIKLNSTFLENKLMGFVGVDSHVELKLMSSG